MQEELIHGWGSDDEASCLFLSKFRLLRAYCPFKVVCVKAVEGIAIGETVEVEEVLRSNPDSLLYYIRGRYYPHSLFLFKPPTILVITRLKKS